MGMTVTEKIIAAHSGRKSVSAGEFVYADVDVALGNDITAPLAISEFRKAGVRKVFDRTRVVLVPDHFTPNKDIKSAEQSKILRDFAREQQLEHYFEVGRMGIEHALLPEQGVVVPGDLIIGADSHTCTYGALCAFSTGVGSTDLAAAMATGKVWLRVPETRKFVYRGRLPKWVGGKDVILFTIGQIGVDGALYQAIEFTGEAIAALGMDDRLTITNMVIECGGKNGIIPYDDVTEAYEKGRAKRTPRVVEADDDAEYADVTEWDVSDLEPQVSAPSLPSNAHAVRELSDVAVDQVVIGSCTNGRISDMEIAAGILKGKQVAPGVRLIVIPGTQEVYLESLRRGYIETFVEAGGVFSTPTCGPCLGGHMGVLAKGEVALATTNRNFVGRMGHPESFVYLAGPAVAAASAVTGKITH
ncbi:MAG TPA: 3-isopropylmalate dehydratase large subunit, partial [Planctomycetota bacterium]|nr:3-isopropylmalate dehydratase large subunit [Planctomycetota bacterium]